MHKVNPAKGEAPVIGLTEASISNPTSHRKIDMNDFNASTSSVEMMEPLLDVGAGATTAISTFTPELSNTDGVITTSSLQVAEHFGKEHRTVLRAIKNLECSAEFRLRNFVQLSREVGTANGGKNNYAVFNITRDGFVFLAMGFTGKEAAQWKEAYITAFHRMEFELYAKLAEPIAPAITYKTNPADALSAGEQEIICDMLTSAVKRLPGAAQAGAMVKGWEKIESHFGVSYRQIPADQFTNALGIVARHITEWELLDAPKKYNFPLDLADPHDRKFGSDWMTPRVLTDPKNRFLELELIEQLEKDGHDVMGVKIRILAMRQALGQVEETKEILRYVRDRIGPLTEKCTVGLIERGKNVQFVGKPDPNSAIDRLVYRDQMAS